MKKKKRRSISLSARAAIALILLSLSTLSGWRDVAIYIGAKCGNTAIITEECIKIQESAVADIYGNRSYRPLYELKLRNGTSVAIYQEETTKFFSSAEELEQCFVTGQSITFTYVRKPAFRDNVFALISAVSSRRFAPPYGSEKAGSKRNSESRHEERSCVPGMDNRPFAAAGAGFLQYKFGGLGHQICHCKAPKGTR